MLRFHNCYAGTREFLLHQPAREVEKGCRGVTQHTESGLSWFCLPVPLLPPNSKLMPGDDLAKIKPLVIKVVFQQNQPVVSLNGY